MGKTGRNFRVKKQNSEAASDLANAKYLVSCGKIDAARVLFARHGIQLVTDVTDEDTCQGN